MSSALRAAANVRERGKVCVDLRGALRRNPMCFLLLFSPKAAEGLEGRWPGQSWIYLVCQPSLSYLITGGLL